MPLSAIFQLYCLVAVSFIGGRKRTTQAEKTTDLKQVTGQLFHNMYRVHPLMSWIRTDNVSGDRN